MARVRLGQRVINGMGPNTTLWDSQVVGFHARRQVDAVAYGVYYRLNGKQRWWTIGRATTFKTEEARELARQVLVQVAQGIDPIIIKQAGKDAAKQVAYTVGDLCDAYWADASSGRLLTRTGKPKAEGTLESDRGRIEGHIRPLLGAIPLTSLTREQVTQMMHDIAAGKTANSAKTDKPRGRSIVTGGKGVATRTTSLLSAMLTYALDKGLLETNPATRIRLYAENKRERRLTLAEYAQLGLVLRANARAKQVTVPAINAVRLLALTGWRRNEALELRWADLDLAKRVAVLPQTKTGKSIRPLSTQACELLNGLTHSADLCFPSSRGGGVMTGFQAAWEKLARAAKLPADITPHTLRHSLASEAADLGYSESTIGALIGHAGSGSMTSRYIHTADAALLSAADKVAGTISAMMAQPVHKQPE